MFKPEDIAQIKAKGISPETIEQQVLNFKNGFPYLHVTEPAGVYHGIIKLSALELQTYISQFEERVSQGISVLKFVPASGAASRMFKSLFSALEGFQNGLEISEILKDKEVSQFFDRITDFAFYDDLKILTASQNKSPETLYYPELLEYVLLERGLNYANLPKGLLKFHQYMDGNRTSVEEHFSEGAFYSKDKDNIVKLHFTVSAEHQHAFELKVAEITAKYENLYGVHYEISFSQQKPSTDTIAVTPENELFRNNDGSLLFRPAGHGALLENLNDLDADVIFIKNIDNVVPDELKGSTVDYKKALAGLLLNLQNQIFSYQRILSENTPDSLESGFYAEAANFLENVLNITPPASQYVLEKEELYNYFVKKFNRPLRVCGMVKNQGEPGGGPFFARNSDDSVSLQIAESSQIDMKNPSQADIARNASHFNPVDLVCAIRNFRGEKYNLLKFSDPETGFISAKSQNGRELKAQELPGLWNGSMADWNTLFVEVPVETFNPVKTIGDLLRKEHQVKK